MPDLGGWVCPAPAARLARRSGDGPRRRRGHVGRADRAPVPPRLRRARPTRDPATPRCVELGGGRLAFSTDSFVVRPMFFPGGASATWPSTAPSTTWRWRAPSRWSCRPPSSSKRARRSRHSGGSPQPMGAAARVAGVGLVTGDTKVVDSGQRRRRLHQHRRHRPPRRGVDIRPEPGRAGRRGDRQRRHRRARDRCHELPRGSRVRHRGVRATRAAAPRAGGGHDRRPAPTSTRCATRPAAAWPPSLNEIADAAGVGIELTSGDLPIPEAVRDACGLLGLDPLHVANEGKLLAIVAPTTPTRSWRPCSNTHPQGAGRRVIGVWWTSTRGWSRPAPRSGGTRVVDLPIGEQLPRDLLSSR